MNHRIALDEIEYLESLAKTDPVAARFLPAVESDRGLSFLEVQWDGTKFEYRISGQFFTRDQAVAILTVIPV